MDLAIPYSTEKQILFFFLPAFLSFLIYTMFVLPHMFVLIHQNTIKVYMKQSFIPKSKNKLEEIAL
ncbi:MAG TPA: hypothetical protein DDW34_03915 [Clostridium sp.]|nr:hypothetical protein [Clostridium sp.]